jgi:hypothetical protein
VFNAAGDNRTGAQFWLHSLLNEAAIHGFDAAAAAGHHDDLDYDLDAGPITNHLAMLTSPTWAAQRSAVRVGSSGCQQPASSGARRRTTHARVGEGRARTHLVGHVGGVL